MKKKSIRQSKNLIISLFAAFLCLAAGTVRAQAGRVTIDMQQVKMTQIMDEIEKQTKFLFIYDKNISVDRTASVQVREQPVAEALAQMLAGTDLTYEINSSNIILSKRSADAAASSSLRNVAGVVHTDNPLSARRSLSKVRRSVSAPMSTAVSDCRFPLR